ncbi:hypothetical protein GGI04_002227 [Coemansia thaxteri]|nr:hypothetical protein GGI04_002227 [Coemansia thaxteri]
MDKVGEFISGLQAILDSPNPPRDDLVRVIQSTQCDFLSSALSISTMTWPTRTHLELVKIVIGLPIQEPPPDVVTADPTTSHESDPFFAADYFEKLRVQLLSTPISQLASSDGSWIRNIGFSIEATIMQASRRADALEKLEELTKADEARGGYDMARIRIYCAHVLGSGTLATRHWESIARTVFTMFYILPCSTKTMIRPTPDNGAANEPFHLHMAQLVMHYSTWLQIVLQVVENHGPAMCRRMPTVVEDPTTKQFKWGIPTLHLVAVTELLRNILMRRLLLPHIWSEISQEASAAVAWASSSAAINAEELRLEQFEQAILGKIIALDASSVYGMMTEQHRLLQVHEVYNKNYEHIQAIPGTSECLGLSLTRTCHGLAPILGFEEQALMQAMDMSKLLECMRDMKATTVHVCYAPLYGCYPHSAASILSYAEILLLRMATTLYNLDQPWGDMANMLSPDRVAGVTPLLSQRLALILRLSAAYYDVFSLNTTEPADDLQAEYAGMSTIASRLMKNQGLHGSPSHPDHYMQIVDSDSTTELGFGRLVDLSIEWLHDFVRFSMTFMAPQLLYTQIAGTVERAVASFVHAGSVDSLLGVLARVSHSQWTALAAIRFEDHPNESSRNIGGNRDRSVLSIIFSIVQRLASVGYLQNSTCDLLDTSRWQATVAMCHLDTGFLAYAIMAQCAGPAGELVKVDEAGNRSAVLSQRGVDVLKTLEAALGSNGASSWNACGLLFSPPIYAGNDGQPAVLLAQSHLASAIKALSTTRLADFAYQLGLAESNLGFSRDDMQGVSYFIQHYVENSPSLFPQLTSLLAFSNDAGNYSPKPNPFAALNILSRVPPIVAPTSPTACNVAATVREWRRQASQLPLTESLRFIKDLVSECYPTNGKHYLELVLVQFMEEEPVVGVELVIASIADHMWTSQLIYLPSSSPFYEIRDMFRSVSPKAPVLSEKGSCIDDKAKALTLSRNEPMFNAIVGGRVRPSTHVDSEMFSKERSAAGGSGALGARQGHRKADHAQNSAMTVRSPVACGRILLLLTALRYGRSMGDTPIHKWLTDCLNHAPALVLQTYFDSLLIERPPQFNANIPTESDWAKKAAAFISAWVSYRQTHAPLMVRKLDRSLLRYILQNEGELWASRWAEWSTAINGAVSEMFTRLRTSQEHAEIVKLMLLVPPTGQPMDAGCHPLYKLASLMRANPEFGKLAFADSKDWFITHAMPPILECVSDSAIARTIVSQLLSSVDNLYQVVPWLDIATSLVQNLPLSHGRPVALSLEAAKRHFVAYVSPLARILFAIARFVEKHDGESCHGTHNVESTDAEEDSSVAKPSVSSPAASETSANGIHDDGNENEDDFNWRWLDELLVVYLSGSSSDPTHFNDTIDSLLDVYTFSSVPGLRQSIENVVVASCLHNPGTARAILKRVFVMRPLDVFTLHSLRPRSLSQLPPATNAACDTESAFRPSSELYPLAKQVLLFTLGDGSPDAVAEVTSLVEDCLWSMAEEPDVRRQLIALKPRLIPKEERPAASATGVNFAAIKHVSSGGLHIPAEAVASAAAYAMDRSFYLLAILLTRDSDSDGVKRFTAELAHSRIILATLMTYVGESMRQFPTIPVARELLTVLWAAVDNGEAVVNGTKAAQIWASVSFNPLAMRLSTQAPEEYMNWPYVQTMFLR